MKTNDFQTARIHGARQPSGWVARTLLAVDTDRVFIDVSDPGLRSALIAEFEAEGRDVVAAGNSKALLAFMEKLPVPDDPCGDVVDVEGDVPGTSGAELVRQLRARGWPITAQVVWTHFLKQAEKREPVRGSA